MNSGDLAACAALIETGSKSFHAASKVLPRRVREPAFALYAFCRIADDAVDLSGDKSAAVVALGARLERVYQGRPMNAPPDRAFAGIVEEYSIPRAVPEALLEGFAWDALERRYANLSELFDYAARVASTVGVMMCLLMGVRARDTLARAADLGVAMQLTNIARDVGEDAREGRLYLPLDWLAAAGLDPDAFLRAPDLHAHRAHLLSLQLLKEADRLYARAEAGIRALPRDCRVGIMAARHIYAEIGTSVRRLGPAFITERAHTSTLRKLVLLAKSATHVAGASSLPQSAVLHGRPLEEVAFLVDAAAQRSQAQSPWGSGRSGRMLDLLAQLKSQDGRSELV